MKKDKNKCKKGKESTIGKIIYGFLLFMPLLAIGVTCAYAIFNKNAYQSWSDTEETINYTQVNTNEFELNKEYSYIYNSQSITGNIQINCDAITLYMNGANPQDVSNYHTLRIDDTRITLLQNGLSTIYANYDHGYYRIDFKYISTYSNTFISNNPFYEKQVTITPLAIDNVFYNSVNKVEESNLFNWTQNSIIYTGMTEFTTSLSITNTFIPLLLTYWLIISLVYFIYDIVLIIFNVLHRKIHELQDSI